MRKLLIENQGPRRRTHASASQLLQLSLTCKALRRALDRHSQVHLHHADQWHAVIAGSHSLLHGSKVSRESDLPSVPYSRPVGVRSFVKNVKSLHENQ